MLAERHGARVTGMSGSYAQGDSGPDLLVAILRLVSLLELVGAVFVFFCDAVHHLNQECHITTGLSGTRNRATAQVLSITQEAVAL